MTIAIVGLAEARPAADDFQLTPAEQERFALMSQSDEWFIKNLRGPREFIDGQMLDPKLQYYLEARRARTPETVKRGLEMFLKEDERPIARELLAREWALFTKVTAPMRSVEDRKVPGGARGEVPIRIYTPNVTSRGPLPILLYFHGGGWLYSSIAAVDRSSRLIANEARCIVISVDYALAPEHPWPAANDDGEAAYLWTRTNAAALGGSPDLIGVGGDSAGGNITLNISKRQIEAGKPAPLFQLLYYTAIDFSPDYDSYRYFGKGYGLDMNFREFMLAALYPREGMAQAAAKELHQADFKRMPASMVVTAGFDMLRDGGRELARRFESNGVAVTYLNYPTLIHGFLQWSAVVPDADLAATESARVFGTLIRSRAAQLQTLQRNR